MESDWDKVTVLHKRPTKASELKSKQAINQVGISAAAAADPLLTLSLTLFPHSN